MNMKLLTSTILALITACVVLTASAKPLVPVLAASAKFTAATFQTNDGQQGSLDDLTPVANTKVLNIAMDNAAINKIQFLNTNGKLICALPITTTMRAANNVLVNLVPTKAGCPFVLQ